MNKAQLIELKDILQAKIDKDRETIRKYKEVLEWSALSLEKGIWSNGAIAREIRSVLKR